MTQDAASRAAETLETEMLVDKHCRGEVSAIIRAEYAELVEACKAVLKNDDADSFNVLIKALKAVEGERK